MSGAESDHFLNDAAQGVEIEWSVVALAVDEECRRAVDTAADAAGNFLTHLFAIDSASHSGLQLCWREIEVLGQFQKQGVA